MKFLPRNESVFSSPWPAPILTKTKSYISKLIHMKDVWYLDPAIRRHSESSICLHLESLVRERIERTLKHAIRSGKNDRSEIFSVYGMMRWDSSVRTLSIGWDGLKRVFESFSERTVSSGAASNVVLGNRRHEEVSYN